MSHTDSANVFLNERTVEREPGEYLDDLPPWDRAEAERLAAVEGLVLNEEHWEVIHLLRKQFQLHGQVRSGRVLVEALNEAFHHRGGSRYLYKLFPHGPVAQASRIAGLPLPPYTTDLSFGSSE